MATLLSRFRRSNEPERSIATVNDYAQAIQNFQYQGQLYGPGNVLNTMKGEPAEQIANDFIGFSQGLYKSNGVVYACMAVRQMVFSGIRFQYQHLQNGRPADLWGDQSLQILETPWPGGTTQDMLSRMEQDVALAGNSYWAVIEGQFVRLRPDWTFIVLTPRIWRGAQVGWLILGYVYYEGGLQENVTPASFLPDEIVHYAPEPDPEASYRGMSWLTPVIREIQSDKQMQRHKQKFFENAATPNLVVRMDPQLKVDDFLKFRKAMDSQHRGAENAYKTLYMAGASDVTAVGADFKQMDFTNVQGHAETRIAASAGIPPVIVGLSEGLQAATYSNYSQARRRFADGTMHPLWSNVAGSLLSVIGVPNGSRLWYDARDVPFLREDKLEESQISHTNASAIRLLADAGFKPDAAVRAINQSDETQLIGQHSGLFSVQLQPPNRQNDQQNADPQAQVDAPNRALELIWDKRNGRTQD